MQSGQRNVDEMKYTIANITMNIIVRSSIRRGWCRGPQHSVNTQRRYDIRAPFM